MTIRLNKLLASRGIGARRKCDLLIEEGQVRVNGKVVRELGTMVDARHDRIEVAGKPIPGEAQPRYYVLNKPVGVISTLSDPEGRRTVAEFLPPGTRLFPVGRLDADTSGLLVLTNDGDLAHHLMHPRYGVEKVYRVWVDHPPTENQLMKLRNGVEFEPGVVSAPARARTLEADRGQGLIELAIHEGRYRQVRRMCEAIGLNVTGLHRWAYGPIKLGPVERGMWRELSKDEVDRLRASSARPTPRGARRGEFFSARRGLVSSQRPPGASSGPRRAPHEPRPREERGIAGAPRRAGTRRGATPRRESAPRGQFERERPTSAAPRRESAPRGRFERERPASATPRREGAPRGRSERERPTSGAPRRENSPRGKFKPERPASADPRRIRARADDSPYQSRPRREPRDFGSPARRQERQMDRIAGRAPGRPPARTGRPSKGDRDSIRRYSRSESNRNEAPPRGPSRSEARSPARASVRGSERTRVRGSERGRVAGTSRGPTSRPTGKRPAGPSKGPAGATRGPLRGGTSSRGPVGKMPRSGPRKGGSARPGRPPSPARPSRSR